MVGEDSNADKVGYELGDDVVGGRGQGPIPVGPGWRGVIGIVVVEDVAPQEVGYFLDEALGE